jgi:starch synthase (maltosyl-transferring)
VRVLTAKRGKPVAARRVSGASAARDAAEQPRLVIESVSPQVDGGAFPAKRTVGEAVEVEAVLFGDGHEQLAAQLRWRAIDEKDWQVARMDERGNDRWTAAIQLERIGRHEFLVDGWLDRFGGFQRDFTKKRDAGVAQKVDMQEGRNLVEQASRRCKGDLRRRLADYVKRIDKAGEEEAGDLLLDPGLSLLMDEADERPFQVTSPPRMLESERLQARFSSWYELFPRSQTDDPERHGTFDDVIARLPQIRAMGFDTLYFPPIHPIGRKHRKGSTNTLTPAPDDPGSPYAIGSDEGGHKSIHPELGSLEDFRRLLDESRRHGMEIALDFAIQCAPDHPWLNEHPDWFDWRPDGTIKYAENPPKKYQDIVNVDFYKPESIPGLWVELRDVVLFWIEQGVKTFRVDNPHTKPFPFWEWMIGDIRAVHPDVIFLSEAFTRPAVMYRLGKIGFSQSYTYFTWRNTKQELTEYFTELTQTEVSEFFRPHLFVNTPDINPTFLHHSGRPGFQIRAALAGTLSGLFGVYSGFELCEAQPVPGKEEYWQSEKYEVKPRDWQAPGNIVEDITLLNRLRRAFPALQSHLGLTFYNAWNDQILCYGKRAPGSDELILVAVSLDPHNPQEADFEVPLWEWGIGDDGSIAVEDLVADRRFSWTGKVQHMQLTPDRPYAIWRLTPAPEAA